MVELRMTPFTPRLLHRLCVVASTLAVVAATGCVRVPPHEREALTRPSMDARSEAGESAFQAHVRESREGSTASAGAAGGGCGCN
jgi:hypothetical protein